MREKTAKDIMEHFGVTRQTILNWRKRGCPSDLKSKGIREIHHYDIKEVERWIEEQRRMY